MSVKRRESTRWAGLIVCASIAVLASGLGQTAWCGDSVTLDAGYYMQDFRPFATRLTIQDKGIQYLDSDREKHMIPWKQVAEWQCLVKNRVGANELLEQEYILRLKVPKDGADRWLHFTFEGAATEAQNALQAMNRYYGKQGK